MLQPQVKVLKLVDIMSKNIYIEKLAEVEDGLPARSMNEHIMGKPNGYCYSSVPIEYSIEGYLIDDIVVGKNVIINRTKRNDEKVGGILTTSRVTEVGNNYFKTQNSVYSYKFLWILPQLKMFLSVIYEIKNKI